MKIRHKNVKRHHCEGDDAGYDVSAGRGSLYRCLRAVTPLLAHWTYCSLALNHRLMRMFTKPTLLPPLRINSGE